MYARTIGLTLALLGSTVSAHATEQAPAPTAVTAAAATQLAYAPAHYGDSLTLGTGRFQVYQKTGYDGAPLAIGVEFHKSALAGLPQTETDALSCWDMNGDNHIDLTDEECAGGHQRTMFFDPNLSPFKYMTVNWEPHGHVPVDVYDIAHFDFHFYIQDYAARNQITPGPCFGAMNCAQVEEAITPVPPAYIHPDFFNTKLVFSRMGNHYADGTSPEFNGVQFTHTFIYGSYLGNITFYEPMISLPYLLTEPNQCTPIKQPQLYAQASYYPTLYCVRFDGDRNKYTVSLEGFRRRKAN